jgi:uncharacterized protein (TIGR02996 family)
MTDEGFLLEILANPADHATRLVYADWLEEQGDTVRADFLRLVEVAAPTLEVAEERRAQRKRLQELGAGLDDDWLASVIGLKIAVVQASFAFAAGSMVSFADGVEVSLDCYVCRRCHRTVYFQPDGGQGKCTPTGHPFPGYWLGKEKISEGAIVSARYRVAFHIESFLDAKYPQHRKPSARPTWARVGFEVVCPRCGHANRGSVQNNIVRPWTWRCQCGQHLYTEVDEMPVLSLLDVVKPCSETQPHAE